MALGSSVGGSIISGGLLDGAVLLSSSWKGIRLAVETELSQTGVGDGRVRVSGSALWLGRGKLVVSSRLGSGDVLWERAVGKRSSLDLGVWNARVSKRAEV